VDRYLIDTHLSQYDEKLVEALEGADPKSTLKVVWSPLRVGAVIECR
jgi:hypothetical protein